MRPVTPPRIAIAGISIESSHFTPHHSGFEAFDIRRGAQMLAWYPWLAPGRPLATRADWVPLVRARALPGGVVEPQVYHQVAAETLALLESAGPFDGLLLDIHGAMTVAGMDDAEGEYAAAIRAAVGDGPVISASLDLHGNVSAQLVGAVDLITCYRTAPHIDEDETRERAASNMLECIESGRRPTRAFVPVPVLLPGEKTSTRLEPARSLYRQLPEITARPGITDASIWVGYAWADEPRCHAAIVVSGDDGAATAGQAERLARRYWQARGDFAFVAPTGTLAECVDQALASTARPFVISDSGDNPTAGGAGDVTWSVTQLLADPRLTAPGGPITYVASLFDADAVAQCEAAGEGARVRVAAGARVDAQASGPVQLDGRVARLTAGDETSGKVAVIAIGNLHVIVTQRRKPYHRLADFEAAGLAARAADIIVVKIGYLEPELYDLAADWRLALTPGGVDQDLSRLGYRRIDRPMYPLDDPANPDLSARVWPPRPS